MCRRFIKARTYGVNGTNTLVPSHFEMKFPTYFDKDYKDSIITLKEGKDGVYKVDGKKKVKVTPEYCEKLDEAFKKQHKKAFEEKKVAPAPKKTGKKETTKKATASKKKPVAKKVVKRK